MRQDVAGRSPTFRQRYSNNNGDLRSQSEAVHAWPFCLPVGIGERGLGGWFAVNWAAATSSRAPKVQVPTRQLSIDRQPPPPQAALTPPPPALPAIAVPQADTLPTLPANDCLAASGVRDAGAICRYVGSDAYSCGCSSCCTS